MVGVDGDKVGGLSVGAEEEEDNKQVASKEHGRWKGRAELKGPLNFQPSPTTRNAAIHHELLIASVFLGR